MKRGSCTFVSRAVAMHCGLDFLDFFHDCIASINDCNVRVIVEKIPKNPNRTSCAAHGAAFSHACGPKVDDESRPQPEADPTSTIPSVTSKSFCRARSHFRFLHHLPVFFYG